MSKPDRRTLREIVGTAVASGVNSDAIAAMAFADRLGSQLWRLKYGNDATSYAPALALVTKRMRGRKKEPFALLSRFAARAIEEYLDDLCHHCGGRGAIYADATAVHACTFCEGTGRKRYGEHDRARAVGLPIDRYRKMASRFSLAAEIITNADSVAARDIADQLSRRVGE